ncbi:MAG: heparinase II/III family protein [Burkholderiaceae bacterium]|nr:heparinase II/III family protein [Burkholderiaceae bacterium]
MKLYSRWQYVLIVSGLAFSLSGPGSASELAEKANRVALERFGEATQLATQPPWDAWVKQESDALRSWMTAPRDNAQWVAGWAHDLADPRTGAFLSWAPSVNCQQFGAEASRTFKACIFMQRQHNIAMMLTAARLYRLTGKVEFAEWAAAQLDLYQSIYSLPSTGPSAPSGKLFLQPLDESTVAASLADTARLLRGHVPADRVEGWCRNLLLPMGRAMLGAQREVHNVAVWYGAGASIMAMECADAAMLESATVGKFGLINLLKTGVSQDGFWFELSPQYQSYVATALTDLLISASLRGEASRFEEVGSYLQSLMMAPSRVAFGGGDGPTINDMNRQVQIPDLALAKRARRVIPTDVGIAESQKSPGWNELLDPVTDALHPLKYPVFDASAKAYTWVAGLKSLYLKDDGWVALLRAGQGERFHAHQDALSVELKFGDTWVFRNSVSPAYGSELHRAFYKLAASYSGPLVDGNGGSNWFKPVSRTRTDGNGVSAEFDGFAKDLSVTRALSVDGNRRFTDAMTFKNTAPAAVPKSTGVLYHSDCTLAAPALEKPPEVLAPVKLSPHITGWSLIHTNSALKTLTMQCGQQQFMFAVSGSRPFRIWRGASPALAPARQRTALYIELEAGQGGWLSTSLSPSN